MSNAISIRIEPLNLEKSSGQRSHDLRTRAPAYVDVARSKDNSVIISPPIPSELRAEMAAARARNRQQKLSARARIFISGIITFGTEAQTAVNAMSKAEQDAAFRRVAERIARESGHPLIGLVVHRDESAIHAHFTLRGFRFEGGKEVPWRFPANFMSVVQDAAAEEVASLGIERGKRKIERIRDGEPKSRWVHKSVRELHNDLPNEIADLKKQIDAVEAKREKNERLALEAEKKGKAVAETYRRREEEAEEKLKAMRDELSRLQGEAQAAVKDVALPPVPKVNLEKVDIVTKKGFLANKTKMVEFVPVEQFRAYQNTRKEREEKLMEWAAQKDVNGTLRLKDVAKKELEIEKQEAELKRRETEIASQEAETRNLAKTIKFLPNSRDSKRRPWSVLVDETPLKVLLAYEKAPLRLLSEQTRYNVALKIFPGRVVVPAQTPATEAQIAAALYRVTRERAKEEKWDGIVFTVSNESMAARLLEMARQDGIEGDIEIVRYDGTYFFHPQIGMPKSSKAHQTAPQRQPEPERLQLGM